MRHPKDEQIFSWDPESMDMYWAQCQRFDHYSQGTAFESQFIKGATIKRQTVSERQTQGKLVD